MYVYNLYNGELFTYEMEGFEKRKIIQTVYHHV